MRPFTLIGGKVRFEFDREELELLSSLAQKHQPSRRFFHPEGSSSAAFGFHWLCNAEILGYRYLPVSISMTEITVCLSLLELQVRREKAFMATGLRLFLQKMSGELGTFEPGFHTTGL